MEPTSVNIFFTVLVGFGMFAALIGTIFPVFPGVGLAWLAALGFGFLAGWSASSIIVMVVITAIAIAALALSVTLPKRSTEATGASRVALWAGLFGAVIGFFAIPIVGFVIGGAAGVYLAEYAARNEKAAAWAATKGTLRGFGVAAVVQVVAVVTIGVVWLAWAGWLYAAGV